MRSITLLFCYVAFVLCYGRSFDVDNGFNIMAYDAEMSDCISSAYPIDLLPENEVIGNMPDIVIPDMGLCSIGKSILSPVSSDNPVIVSITTSAYGQVAGLLEEKQGDTATEIILSGPIDGSDFKALWECAINGNLQILDLHDADIKNKTIPDYALYDPIQIEVGHWLGIKRIILPDDIVTIGKVAFAFMRLEEINIPSSLRKLGSTAFAYDYWLDCPIELPEGLEEIRYQTFYNCRSLSSSPVLPGSLKKIGQHAFANTYFQDITFNDGLEFIGEGAFQSSGLIEVRFPDSIVEIEPMAFQLCDALESIHFPATIKDIPYGIFSFCNELRQVGFPTGVRGIEDNAFMWCTNLSEVTFPETLESIGQDAFGGCALETVVFPSELKVLGSGSFAIDTLHTVYCASETPPLCVEEPFPPFAEEWISEAVLYVPEGCRESYMNQWEWSLFKEIIETDRFPSSVISVTKPDDMPEDMIFDLSGRKIVHPLPNHIYIKNGKKTYMH